MARSSTSRIGRPGAALVESHAAADGRLFDKRLADDRWIATSRYRLRNGWVAALRVDITELTRRELALRESEERFRALADVTFEAVVVQDFERIVDANHTFLELFDYSYDEVVGMDLWRLAAPAGQAEAAERIKRRGEPCEQADLPFELLMRRKDGSTFPAELRGKSVHYGGKLARVVAMRDIAAPKRSEDHIRRLAHHDCLTELPIARCSWTGCAWQWPSCAAIAGRWRSCSSTSTTSRI